MNFCPSCREVPIAESPPNPTIQLLNNHPKFSLPYLGDREAVRRTERVKPLTTSARLDLSFHKIPIHKLARLQDFNSLITRDFQ
jgi:hypothetical protein